MNPKNLNTKILLSNNFQDLFIKLNLKANFKPIKKTTVEKEINNLNKSIDDMIDKLKKLEKNSCILTNTDIIELLNQVKNISKKLNDPIKKFTSNMSKNIKELQTPIKKFTSNMSNDFGELQNSIKEKNILNNLLEMGSILKSKRDMINNKIR